MAEKLKDTIGLGISNSALTAVQLACDKAGLRVLNYSYVELKPGIIEENSIIVDMNAFKESLKQLLLEGKRGPISSRDVIISVPEEKIFAHYINIPKEYANDIEFIKEAARDYIPIDLSEAIMDFKQIPGASTDKELKYSFVAVQKSIIEPLISTLSEIGLNVVAVDTKKDSLIRFCDNQFHKNKSDFMVVDVDMQTIFLCAANSFGISHIIDTKITGRSCLERIKENLEIMTFADIKNLLIELKRIENPEQNEKYQIIKQNLGDVCKILVAKGKELVEIMNNEKAFKPETIYFIGCLAHLPGLKEEFKQTFPETKIIEKVEYIQLEEETELFYPEAIGLALRASCFADDVDEINLLPWHLKEKMDKKKLTPLIMAPLLGLVLILGAVMVFSGISTLKNIANYKLSETQQNIVFEESQNPYLLHAAQTKQQIFQLENQIKSLLADSIPGSQVMKKVDSFNLNGTGMITATYAMMSDKKIEVKLRAKSLTRENTENFIAKLEEDPYFTEVISPLSNLVGKGERFINMDLILNPEEIIADFYQLKESQEKSVIKESEEAEPSRTETDVSEETEKKKPSIQPTEEESDNAVNND